MTAITTATRENLVRGSNRMPFWFRVLRHELGKFRPRNQSFYRAFPLPRGLEQELLRFDRDMPEDSHGRCPFRKMQAMASLIVRHGLRHAVEIGVYRGSSLLPQALAMRLTGGCAVGIDPWSLAEWRQEEAPPGRQGPYRWKAPEIDWAALYHEVLDRIARYGVERHCRVIRGLSHKVADDIVPGIDLLHIDGNHDSGAVARDLELYLPKLRHGGYLVLDDITWPGIAPRYADLRRTMSVTWETMTWAVLRNA